MFWKPLLTLLSLSFSDEHYSHIALIPALSFYLLYSERKRIFSHLSFSYSFGIFIILIGIIIDWYVGKYQLLFHGNEYLSVKIFSFIIICVGTFIVCYGIHTFRAALFPVLFLILMVPIPDFLLQKLIFGLQSGSATATNAFFYILGIPVFRLGFNFSLPGVTIQVAQECSGIRSSVALFITALLAGHLFLRSGWSKLVLCLAVIPITIIKNGFRIAALSWLGLYVNKGFLTGRLHHHGGILFFLLGFAVLMLLVRFLRYMESYFRQTKITVKSAHAEAGNS